MTIPQGNADAHAAFLAAMTGSALHHAWLFTGPQGVGKASFARTAALRMLVDAAHPGKLAPGFDVPDDDRTRALIAAGSHPDYRELVRLPKDPDKPGQDLARSITIAQVRALQPMFATTPSMSPRRVILIDSVDDLERPGASNALLKNLEEPPAGTIFLLISHSPGRLLPTIRSRCRRLRFDPLSDEALAGVLRAKLPETSEAEIGALVRAADGSPGRALGYAGLDMAALDGVMTAIARDGDRTNAHRTNLAKALSLKAAQPRYEAFLDRVPTFIAEASADRTGESLKTALDAYDGARALAISARALSLDQQATVYEMAGLVAKLAAR
ncbi:MULTISPECIES: AAA family ATPase [unclassified Sphingomonas]|uniref:AAA family ATPase n=1 Tax=unclassified Sphingomonas TaxID=196159 RepID=UPI000BD0736F|nr:MAG: DNA polymerase III subunit delta' [Sphingomonas sp. 12-62-6]OYX36993.1 MAG: DNA polymerase III subunit delta' [Sphingomonas sp. 32-62-10]